MLFACLFVCKLRTQYFGRSWWNLSSQAPLQLITYLTSYFLVRGVDSYGKEIITVRKQEILIYLLWSCVRSAHALSSTRKLTLMNFLRSWATISFKGRILLRGIRPIIRQSVLRVTLIGPPTCSLVLPPTLKLAERVYVFRIGFEVNSDYYYYYYYSIQI
jgi:hypothetical protein